jgi:hypothetical protein
MLSMLETLTQVISKRLSSVMRKADLQLRLMTEKPLRISQVDTIAILKQIKCLQDTGPVDYLNMQKVLASREVVVISGKPYTDLDDIRTFDINEDQSEFVWHRDKEDRLVEVISGNGWQFQPENCLPLLLQPGIKFKIKEGEYHRLIKGIDNLQIRITKLL